MTSSIRKTNSLHILGTAAILFASFSSNAVAFGDIPPFQGAKSAGRAGVGAAFAEDGTSGNYNPALLSSVGDVISLHPGVFYEDQTSDYLISSVPALGINNVRALGPQKDKWKYKPVAYFGWNYDVKNTKWSVGQSVTGIGNFTKFQNNYIIPPNAAPAAFLAFVPGSAPGYNTYGKLFAPELNNIVSYRLNDRLALATSFILGYKLFQTNFLTPTGQITTNSGQVDHSWGAGLKFGAHWKALPQLEIGAAIGTPIFYSRLKKYSQILTYCPNEAWNGLLGFAWHVTQKTTLGVDVEGDMLRNSRFYGVHAPLGFGLTNAVNYKISLQHKFLPGFTGRIGYNYGKPPIRDDSVYVNIFDEATVLTKHMLGAGFTFCVNKKFDVDFAFNYFPTNTLMDNGINTQGASNGMKISARVSTAMLGLNYKY